MTKTRTIKPGDVIMIARSCDNVLSSALSTGLKKNPFNVMFAGSLDPHLDMEKYRGLAMAPVVAKKDAFVNINEAAMMAALLNPFYPGRSATSEAAREVEKNIKKSVDMSFRFFIGEEEVPADITGTIMPILSLVPIVTLDSVKRLSIAVGPAPAPTQRSNKAAKRKEKGKEKDKDKSNADMDTGDPPHKAKKSKLNDDEPQEPGNWAEIKAKNGWDKDAKWFPGRDVPTTRGDMRKAPGGRISGSKRQDDGSFKPPLGSVKPTPAKVHSIASSPHGKATGNGDQPQLIALLKEQLLQKDHEIARLTQLDHDNNVNFVEWRADDQQKELYANHREELYTAAMKTAKQWTNLYHCMAKGANDLLPAAPDVGADLPKFEWKWQVAPKIPKSS